MWLRIKTDIDASGRMGRLHPARYIKEDDVMPLALSQSNPDVGASPSFCSGRKLGDMEQALLWSVLQEDPQCPSRLLLDEAARRQRPIAVSLRQLNRWRVQWQLNRRPGRPRQTPYPGSAVSGAAVVRVRPRLSFVGVHLFAHWLDHQGAFDPVVAQLTQAEEALVPTLVPAQAGQITSIDGHMSASWSRVAMHKGKITMRGRIMAGSQAVIAHNEAGYAVFLAYHPPDIHLSRVIVAYC